MIHSCLFLLHYMRKKCKVESFKMKVILSNRKKMNGKLCKWMTSLERVIHCMGHFYLHDCKPYSRWCATDDSNHSSVFSPALSLSLINKNIPYVCLSNADFGFQSVITDEKQDLIYMMFIPCNIGTISRRSIKDL